MTAKQYLRRLSGAALALLLPCGAAVSAPTAWPVIAVPAGIETFATGGEMRVNGLPLHMRGVLSARTPAQVAALFRASLGQPLTEHTRDGTLVLGRALGEFYATVQLQPAGSGTRGLLAVSRLGAAPGPHDSPTDRLLSRFPAGSRLLTQTRSVDGPRRAELLTVSNAMGVESNVRHLRRALEAQGYTLERADSAASAPGGATSLFFKTSGSEALAVIYRDSQGNTAIALNTITRLESAR